MVSFSMSNNPHSSRDREAHVLSFRRRPKPHDARRQAPSPVKDLTKYESSDDADDYRHRMLMNLAALLFVATLIGVGLWIADTMAAMRKNQDCVLSGRRGCTPVMVEHNRW